MRATFEQQIDRALAEDREAEVIYCGQRARKRILSIARGVERTDDEILYKGYPVRFSRYCKDEQVVLAKLSADEAEIKEL